MKCYVSYDTLKHLALIWLLGVAAKDSGIIVLRQMWTTYDLTRLQPWSLSCCTNWVCLCLSQVVREITFLADVTRAGCWKWAWKEAAGCIQFKHLEMVQFSFLFFFLPFLLWNEDDINCKTKYDLLWYFFQFLIFFLIYRSNINTQIKPQTASQESEFSFKLQTQINSVKTKLKTWTYKKKQEMEVKEFRKLLKYTQSCCRAYRV